MNEQSLIWPLLVGLIGLILGVRAIRRGWQIAHHRRHDLIADWDRHPLPNASRYANAYARINIGFGLGLVAVPFLLLTGVSLAICSAGLVLTWWYWLFAIDSLATWARE